MCVSSQMISPAHWALHDSGLTKISLYENDPRLWALPRPTCSSDRLALLSRPHKANRRLRPTPRVALANPSHLCSDAMDVGGSCESPSDGGFQVSPGQAAAAAPVRAAVFQVSLSIFVSLPPPVNVLFVWGVKCEPFSAYLEQETPKASRVVARDALYFLSAILFVK